MKLKNKVKVEVFITEPHKIALKSKADELGTTMTEVIKRALEQFLK